MRIVLTDTSLNDEELPADVQVENVSLKSIDSFEHNSDVVAIVGSRALAIKAEKMDFPSLKLIQLTSAGFDGVPVKEYESKGVSVQNAGGIYSVPIAETVVFGMLSTAKKLRSNPNNRRPKLKRNYSFIQELAEKRVMILGAGSIGTEVAKRLSGFDMIVDGYAQSDKARQYFNHVYCGREQLVKLIGNYDYVVSTLPDTNLTRGFFDRELLLKMKRSAVIVNVGRRKVFNEDDLFTALKSKIIGGAVLDMYELLPNPITNRFRRLSNVIVIPAVAAKSLEVKIRLCNYLTKSISRLLNEPQESNDSANN